MSAMDFLEPPTTSRTSSIPRTAPVATTISTICTNPGYDSTIDPTTILQCVRDHLSTFQERRGIPRDENNFIGLVSIIIQQAGHAMYAVFTLFLALFPVVTIFLAILHFFVDRLIDVIACKSKPDMYIKLGILCSQLSVVYFMTQFVLYNIFGPIFTLQMSIISKMLLLSRGNFVSDVAMRRADLLGT